MKFINNINNINNIKNILFFLTVYIVCVSSKCSKKYVPYVGTIMNYTFNSDICDACMKYQFITNYAKDNSDLRIVCKLPGYIQCISTDITITYYSDTTGIEYECEAPTTINTFGEKEFAVDFIKDKYPLGDTIPICVDTTDSNKCMLLDTSGALHMFVFSFLLSCVPILIAIVLLI